MAKGSTHPGSNESAVDEAAVLEALSRAYRSPLTSFFRKRIADRSDVDDLVQEVFVRLARRGDLSRIQQIEGYLFQTAASILRDRVRRRAVRRYDVHEPFDERAHAGEFFSPERVLQGRQEVAEVVAALHELPERTRAIFALHRFEELAYGEIARRLGISVSAVEKHMMKAIAHLSRRLGRP